MTGPSVTHVYLEDGAGAFTNDVSAFARISVGVDITRGRNDEQTDVVSGSVDLRLDNTDGRFTLGSASYNGITVDKRIQITEVYNATTYTRFTGYVQEWPTQWESGIANLAFATITAVDRQARLARRKLLSMGRAEMLADAPAFLYALDEDINSVTVGDTSGLGGASLGTIGLGTAPTFGTALNTWDSATGCGFVAAGQIFSGTGQLVTTGTTLTFALVVVPNGLNGTWVTLTDYGPASLGSLALGVGINSSGQITVFDLSNHLTPPSIVSTTAVYTSGEHTVHLTMSGSTVTLWVDGVSIGSGTASLFGAITAGRSLGLAVGGDPNAGHAAIASTLAMVAGYNGTLSSPRIAAQSTAALTGFPTDTADVRLGRLAGYANIVSGDRAFEAGQTPSIAAQPTSGVFALDAMRAVALAEGGLLFISGDGKLTMQNKVHRVLKATGTPGLTITADQIDPTSLVITGDKNYLYNTGTGSRTNGAQQRLVNTTSVGKYEEYDIGRDVALLPTDDMVLNQLQWITTMYGEPLARISALTLDLMTLPTATVQAALALELGDLIRLSSLPTQAPAASTDLLVEGFKESQTQNAWSITFNMVPASLFYAPVVDSSGTNSSSVVDTGRPVYF